MEARHSSALLIALALAACDGGESGTSPTGTAATTLPPPPSTTASTTAAPATTSTPATTTSNTPPVCEPDDALAAVDASIAQARLAQSAEWASEVVKNRFVERTTTGGVFANRLGLDCGIVAGQTIGDNERLVVAAWTGPRLAWVVQTTEAPATPYASEATVTVVIDDTEGEFVDNARTIWAGTFDSGETFVIGHIDYNLGAAAKGWLVDAIPFDSEPTLASERHAFETLDTAGMRNIGIAEPAELGSEEGHVQFISATGQISVADVAPTGWFDLLQPRYLSGETRIEQIDGAEIRVTEPGSVDQFAVAAEIGFACDDYVWLLQPPFNGDTTELIDTARVIIATSGCRAG
jgi:hypothetical protein